MEWWWMRSRRRIATKGWLKGVSRGFQKVGSATPPCPPVPPAPLPSPPRRSRLSALREIRKGRVLANGRGSANGYFVPGRPGGREIKETLSTVTADRTAPTYTVVRMQLGDRSSW